MRGRLHGIGWVLLLVLAGCDASGGLVAHDAAAPRDGGTGRDAKPDAVRDARVDATHDAAATEETLEAPGITVVVHLAPFGLEVQNGAGTTVLSTVDDLPTVTSDTAHAYGPLGASHRDTVINTPIIEGWDHTTGTDGPWAHTSVVTTSTFTKTTASLDLVDPKDSTTKVHVDLTVTDAELLFDAHVVDRVQTPSSDPRDQSPLGLNEMGQSFVLAKDEHFFGLGERFVTVDQRGTHYECWTEEGGIGQGESVPPGPHNPSPNGPDMTHAPIPYFVSTRGYGMYLETTFRTGFSLGADDDTLYRVYSTEPHLRYHVFVHADPKDTLAAYTKLTGRAFLPAPWVFGPRRRVDHGAMALGMPEEQALRAANVPTTMIDDATHFLPIASDADQVPFLMDWCSELHALGYKSIGYYNAYVSTTNAAAADLLTAGRAGDYFLKLEDGTEFDTYMVSAGGQTVATVDFTKPGATAWYQTILQRALDIGYDGWMLDFGEYVPPLAKTADGRTGWEAHNAYPVMYDQAVTAYLQQVRPNDFMYFARAGYVGSQASIPVMWSGDPSASFDDVKGLPANVRAGLNAGLSGFPFWGSDISGYTCLNDPPADKEVYLRWAEFGALSSDMHDENACSAAPAGAPPKWTLWSDAETTQVYAEYASLHTRLFPYTYAAASEAVATGLPILRHPILYYPNKAGARAAEFDYFFGPSLYVAPVVRRGEITRTLWLPPGEWIDWWTLAPLLGGSYVNRRAPLDTLPLFQKSGSIIAMLDPSVQTLAPATTPGIVTAADVAGVLDLRTVVDPMAASATATLVDGTVLTATLAGGALALPANVTLAATEADLATCTLCGRIDSLFGATRIRITGASDTQDTLVAGGLTLTHSAPSALRPRWDVVVIDARD
jgi:alpha-glucosidase